jgi:hypothetical protein
MVLVGFLALFVLADTDNAIGAGKGFRILRGEGSVCAAGNGIVQFHGTASLVAQVKKGQLIVSDETAVVEIRGNGTKHTLPNGWVLYQGFNGSVHLEGEELFAQIMGRGLRMKAEGQGIMMLVGRGLYRSPCEGSVAQWGFINQEGLAVELGDYMIGSEELAE